MHSRKKGQSGSRKPAAKTAPPWLEVSAEECVSLIKALAKEGTGPEAIGRTLRDKHGIPSVRNLTGKTVTQILKEEGMLAAYPSDLISLIRRAVGMRKHIKTNNRDVSNKSKLHHVEGKIKRLVKYYRGKKLPKDWKYEPEQAELLVK